MTPPGRVRAYQLTCELSANTCTDSEHLPWQLAKHRILQTRAGLSAGAGARREEGEDHRLAPPAPNRDLGAPHPCWVLSAWAGPDGHLKLRASANWHGQWSQGMFPPGLLSPGSWMPPPHSRGTSSVPCQLLGTWQPQDGDPENQAGPRTPPPPQALGTPPGWPWAGGGGAPWLLSICTADTPSGSPRRASWGSQAS